jgi:hypothetical protein
MTAAACLTSNTQVNGKMRRDGEVKFSQPAPEETLVSDARLATRTDAMLRAKNDA